jgi:hypothetical protein
MIGILCIAWLDQGPDSLYKLYFGIDNKLVVQLFPPLFSTYHTVMMIRKLAIQLFLATVTPADSFSMISYFLFFRVSFLHDNMMRMINRTESTVAPYGFIFHPNNQDSTVRTLIIIGSSTKPFETACKRPPAKSIY